MHFAFESGRRKDKNKEIYAVVYLIQILCKEDNCSFRKSFVRIDVWFRYKKENKEGNKLGEISGENISISNEINKIFLVAMLQEKIHCG